MINPSESGRWTAFGMLLPVKKPEQVVKLKPGAEFTMEMLAFDPKTQKPWETFRPDLLEESPKIRSMKTPCFLEVTSS